ncbi:MAG: hypothetical protein LBE12_02270 [Planctomycetaceae bacterium]|jgi:hypothetical protein|nr:hypothetical protein [Planctomycetaceae bacterium]
MFRFDKLLDAVNPVFALTIRMQNCRKIFVITFIAYSLVLIGLLIFTTCFSTPIGNLTRTVFFELVFFTATCCVLVFLGSDFGTVFIESTFQDELLRLTPLTPLQIIHGSIGSSFFFSFGLLCPAFPLLFIAYFLHFPVGRLWGETLLLFFLGQTFNLILLSSYIYARSWKDISFGVSITFLIMILLGIFYFTETGSKFIDPVLWYIPVTFLLVVTILLMGIAYILVRNHACHPKRSFFQTVLINFAVYIPFLILVCTVAVFIPM